MPQSGPHPGSRPPGVVAYAPPGHSSGYVRAPVCPTWMPRDEFDAIKHDPELLYEACHKRLQEYQQTLETTKRLNDALLQDTQYQYAHAVQQFEELRQEHLALNDSYNDLETVNETVQEVVEVLRTDKHQLLVELNGLKREISVTSIENTQLALKEKEALAFQQSLDRKLESQEEQLRQLDNEMREYSQAQVQVSNEVGALESAAHNLSLQAASLSELRTHLDATRVQQEQAIRALEAEIEQKQQEIAAHDEQLWDFKREMSARILALQRKVQQSNDELGRLHRLSEHEMNTLSQQNRALNEELKNKTDQLFGTRKEMTEFATAARREINIKREEIQQCMSIIDLVERQNQGLESSIARMLEQNHVSEAQIQGKDNTNNKNLIEQANFIAMVHMELQTVREDLYMIKSRLCHHCRERLLAEEAAEDAKEQQLQELQRLRQGAEAYAKSLVERPPAAADAASPPPAGTPPPGGGAPAPPGTGQSEGPEVERERQRMKDELRKAHEALEALNRQLLEERESRAKERREDEDSRAQEEEDRLLRAQDEEARRRRAQEDEKRKAVGEEAKAFTVRFSNNTRKKVDAFMTDTVQEFLDRTCSKVGLRPSDLFYIAHAVNENSVLGVVDRFLDRTKTMYEEGVTTKCNLNFKYKHYKKLRRWADMNAQQRFFEQVHRMVVTEAYPLTEKLAVHLAGYELQSVFGDPTGKKRHSYFDKVGLDAYLPVGVSPLGYSYWQERLYLSHRKRRALAPADARHRYLDAARERCSHWGMTFFDIRDKENRPFVAGIAEDGLHVLSADKRVFLQSLRFLGGPNQLAGWEKSSTGLFVKRRDSNKMTLYASSKLQSQEMFNLLNEYYLLLPREIQQQLGIAIQDREHIANFLPSPDLFEPPLQVRPPPVEFESPVEFLKATYLEHVFSPGADEGDGAGPCLKFVEQLDKALDDEQVYTELDVSEAHPELLFDGDMILICDLLIRAREYDPDEEPVPVAVDRRLNWQENLDLTKFNVADNALTERCLPELRRVIETFQNLTDVNLSGVPLDNRYEESLIHPLLRLNLQSLTLRKCGIGDRGLRPLLELFQNRTLKSLDLNDNRITQHGLSELCALLDQPYCSLTSLAVGTNKIALRGLETLIKVMERSRRPVTLDFSDNPLQARGGQRFGQLIEQQCGLTSLDISNETGQMNITGDVALYITRQLLNNPEVKMISFSDNPIGTNLHQLVDPAGQLTRDLPLEFFTFLERTAVCVVEDLKMNRCGLNHDHGAALTSALVDNYKLKSLYVSGNRLALSDGGLPQGWMDLLEMTHTLEKLDISKNGLTGRGVSLLCNALGKNRSLKWVDIQGNRFVEDGEERWDEVMYMFATNRVISELNMSDMGMSDEVLERISEGLSENRTMKTLTARDNPISCAGVVRATKHLANNVTLETLDLVSESVQADEEDYMRTYKLLIDGSNLETVHL
eukprot:Hpha_TRINITY_DN15587_c1_g8::TRINITY_DN15587_c1_g8_i1::g.108462::m.108462